MKKPKLGQNFLVDDAVRHRIADALGDISQTTVVEIGPGHGAITEILARRAQRLICIELDRSLAAELRFRFRNDTHVEVIEADILQTDLSVFTPANGRIRLVGNLPYYITSDILLHLCYHASVLELAIVMMQREVADRVAAVPGTREYGLLSVSVQVHATVAALMVIPPDAFCPPPEVFSTVLRLAFHDRFDRYGITEERSFTSFLRSCFQQKRKTLANNLKSSGLSANEVRRLCEQAAIPPESRAEELPVPKLVALFLASQKDRVMP